MHSCIFNVAYAIKSKMRSTFAKEDGTDCYASGGGVGVRKGEIDLPHIIKET